MKRVLAALAFVALFFLAAPRPAPAQATDDYATLSGQAWDAPATHAAAAN